MFSYMMDNVLIDDAHSIDLDCFIKLTWMVKYAKACVY